MKIEEFKFDEKGLICAIAQDAESGEVLMQAYMNREALEKSLQTGFAHYYSRSRKKLWKKGEESGHVQKIVQMLYDCDADCVLMKVHQSGAACHTQNNSCFYRVLEDFENCYDYKIIFDIVKTLKDRKENPKEGSYTNYLFTKGVDKICKKVGEESAEVIIAAKNNDNEELANEISDLIYHVLVLMEQQNLSLSQVFGILMEREGKAPHPKYKLNQ